MLIAVQTVQALGDIFRQANHFERYNFLLYLDTALKDIDAAIVLPAEAPMATREIEPTRRGFGNNNCRDDTTSVEIDGAMLNLREIILAEFNHSHRSVSENEVQPLKKSTVSDSSRTRATAAGPASATPVSEDSVATSLSGQPSSSNEELWGLTPEFRTKNLSQAREMLHKHLLETKIGGNKPGSAKRTLLLGFSNLDNNRRFGFLSEIMNALFEDTLGSAARKRITTLIKEYNKGAHVKARFEARQNERDDFDVHPAIRDFKKQLKRSRYFAETKPILRANSLELIYEKKERLDFLKSYYTLLELAGAPIPDQQFLTNIISGIPEKFRPCAESVTNVTPYLKQYLEVVLHYKKKPIASDKNSGLQFISHFGTGSLILLPPHLYGLYVP